MGKERKVSLVMSVLVSALMGIVASFLVMYFNTQAVQSSSIIGFYLTNVIISTVMGLVIAFVIPLGKIGNALAKKAHAAPPSFKFILLNGIPMAIGNTFIISLALSFLGVKMARSKLPAEALATLPPLPIMWLKGFIQLLLPTLVISYLFSIILAPLVARAVGFPKQGGPQGGPGGPKKEAK